MHSYSFLKQNKYEFDNTVEVNHRNNGENKNKPIIQKSKIRRYRYTHGYTFQTCTSTSELLAVNNKSE